MSAFAPPTATSLPTRDAVLPQAERENFTVASAVLGRRRQAHLMAIYGYARLVDDVGDESPGDRRWWLAGTIKRDEYNGGNAAEMH